jgi:hypothetical protein
MIPEIGKENQFMKNYLSLEKKLSRLYWRKNPYWFLPFKKFDDEEFKEINRYYGFYFISNYGQVVSFHRRFPRLLRYQFLNGSFVVGLSIQGVPTKHYIHDLVYAHFCKPFDSDYNVVHRNGISTDNYYKNLRLKVRRNVPIHKRRRKKRHDFSLFFRIESEAPPSSALSLSILQFDKGGKFLREYPSIKMASVGSGVSTSDIILCCIGKKRFSRGYQWKYKRDPLFKKGICNIEPVKKLTYYNVIAVLQFDCKGKFIKEYSSIVEAVKFTGTSHSNISKCVSYAGNFSAGGFQWRYKDDPIFKDGIKNIGPASMLDYSHYKGILKFDLNGNFIKEFASVRKAARDIGKRHALISRCALGEAETAYGFLWKFRSDPLFANGITNIEPVHKPGKPEPRCILQFTLSGKFIKEFRSPEHAAREYGVTPTVIEMCLKGQSRMSAGFLWRYKDDPLFKNGVRDIAPVRKKPDYSSAPVLRFDLRGNYQEEFPSAAEAARIMGIPPRKIRDCLNGKLETSAGYRWRFKDDPLFKNGKINVEPSPRSIINTRGNILQFDRKGTFIREYESPGHACRKLEINLGTLYTCLRGKTKTCGGYQWRYADDPAFKNGITDLEEVKPKRFRNAKIIVQCDLEGNIIKEYHSIGEASRQLGINRRHITLCANGKEKTAAGFTWKWKQE